MNAASRDLDDLPQGSVAWPPEPWRRRVVTLEPSRIRVRALPSGGTTNESRQV